MVGKSLMLQTLCNQIHDAYNIMMSPPSLEELNVSSNQLSALPPANLMPEKNIVTQLYASCNRLGEGSISNIAGSVFVHGCGQYICDFSIGVYPR